ncbi:CoxG family protein [Albidovulum sp.]|jgi:carbon monoxide dehydrogenase subunit G|uniref:CoxG family protein n=1 Tax=Albidovulum sp. TaxID=1872424 RepID=UPI0030500C46
MQLTDHRDIKAGPEAVWAAILDPEVLRACIPGCESLTGSPEEGYEAMVVQKVGPVKARFTGIVALSEIEPGRAVTISGEGKGGPAGFAKGGARVTLEPGPEGTRLSYEVEASVGGKLAQLGSRLIDGFAKKLADEFFERFKATVEGPDTDGPGPDGGEGGPEGGPESGTEEKKGWLKRVFGS